MSTKLTYAAILVLLSAALGDAQDTDYHHNNITVGGGAADPVGNSTNYLSTAPLFEVGYGYRFNRWFQVDAGFQIAFGAANNQNAEVSDFGTVQGGDHEFMVPLGGRVFIPTRFSRVEASVGGGAAYLHYAETVPSTAYVQNSCYSCTSRGGWGGYGMANVNYFLDQNRNFHVGTTVQFIAASTDGQPVGDVPGLKTTDHWVNAFVELGFSF